MFDAGESEHGPFIVMELIAGRTLRAMLRESSSAAAAIDLGRQIARALAVAHAAGIVHRDIKPENVMVRDDGYVKVLDFGIARMAPATDWSGADDRRVHWHRAYRSGRDRHGRVHVSRAGAR